MDRTKLPALLLRTMGVGSCTYLISFGNFKVPCPCQHGVLTLQLGATLQGNEDCQECTHPLSVHGDFSPTSGLNFFPGRTTAAANRTADMSQSLPSNPATTGQPVSMAWVSPHLSHRKDTVAALWELVQQTRVVHVRGTPASGKSVLAHLLQNHVEKTCPSLWVYLITWNPAYLSSKKLDIGSTHDDLFNCVTGQSVQLRDWHNVQNTLLLIDEAQLSYEYSALWNDFMKLICGIQWGPWVVLFSSYGSPSDSPLQEGNKFGAPMAFSKKQRVSIRPLYENNPSISLYFTRPEFDEVVARICEQYANQQPFNPSSDLIDHIWKLCNGHPGGTVAIFDALIHSEVCFATLLFVILANLGFRIRN
jgi:hypothetical protein